MVVLVHLAAEKLRIYVTEVYATMSSSSADCAVSTVLLSNNMLSCVTHMLAHNDGQHLLAMPLPLLCAAALEMRQSVSVFVNDVAFYCD